MSKLQVKTGWVKSVAVQKMAKSKQSQNLMKEGVSKNKSVTAGKRTSKKR